MDQIVTPIKKKKQKKEMKKKSHVECVHSFACYDKVEKNLSLHFFMILYQLK
jgi:hypothetical protein